MPQVFVYGTLRHVPLLHLVAGQPLDTRPAMLTGYRIATAKGEDYPVPVAEDGATAEGLLCDMPDTAFARADWYENAFDYKAVEREVEVAGARVPALVWLPGDDMPEPVGRWTLDGWVPGWAELTMRAAGEAMALFGRVPAAQIGRYWHAYQFRADSAMRAEAMRAPSVGSLLRSDEVVLDSRNVPHSGYFATRVETIRHPRFSGGMTDPQVRETYMCGDAAVVLPYDPVRDRILLTEQFRMGPYARGATYPWVLEAVAGRIDPGETPESTAMRECVEEAGLTLSKLLPVADYHTSTGSTSEYAYVYVGLCDLPDRPKGGGGLEEEGEDIRTILLSFDEAMDLISSGEANDGQLILLLLWLARERPGLRATA